MIRPLESLRDMEDAAALVERIWGERLITIGELRAFEHAGNPVLGAFEGETMIGTSIAFIGMRGGLHLHSHITGVEPGREHAGVGLGLKMAQRDWCLEHGVSEVLWTFDPLVARNAYFNFHKLGATAGELLVNFYGAMTDEINRGDFSDRLLVRWSVASAPRERAVTRELEIPPDYPELRRADIERARDVRMRTRDALLDSFGAGLEVVDFTRDGRYRFAVRDA